MKSAIIISHSWSQLVGIIGDSLIPITIVISQANDYKCLQNQKLNTCKYIPDLA